MKNKPYITQVHGVRGAHVADNGTYICTSREAVMRLLASDVVKMGSTIIYQDCSDRDNLAQNPNY